MRRGGRSRTQARAAACLDGGIGNNGSGDIVSAGNNWIVDSIDAPGPVYITPNIIGPK
jgi:hypothetical protein